MNMNKLNLATTDRIVTIAVDIQNDFCPGGTLAVAEGDQVVDPMNRAMALTRHIGGQVVATRDWHPDQTPHFNDWPITDEAGAWPRHCVAETEGAAFHPKLDIQPDDIIINKGTGQDDGYSGFEGISDNGTTLEQLISPTTPDENIVVLFGGLATDYCDRATGLDAAKQADQARRIGHGSIRVYGMIDAMRAVNLSEGDEERAIAEMESAGIQMITTAEFANAARALEA